MDIFNIIFPIFALALLGYVLTIFKFFSREDIAGISRYVFNVAIPVLLFDAMADIELPEEIQWAFLFSYYLAALFIFALGNWLGRTRFGHSRAEQGIFGLGASYSNTVLIGLPVISSAFGDEALLPMFLLISLHAAILFTAVTAVVESDTGPAQRRRDLLLLPLTKIARNPIIGGLIVGLLFNWLAIPLPGVLADTIGLIRTSALPCALFVMGASLSEYKLAGHLSEAWTIVGLKMVLQPLLVWLLAFVVFHLAPLWGTVAVITAALPVGINASMFAHKYDACIAPVASATIISTLLSIGSLTLLLAWFL